MEFLVTMTTHVPQGTPDQAVTDIRAREAARSSELAAHGHLLRLWRPPLAPGEWRTLGLFAAADAVGLEEVLASMPLRIWRTDEVTPLSPHPNDPAPDVARSPAGYAREFLTTFGLVIPDGTPQQTVDDGRDQEAQATRELAKQGHLSRLWTLPPEPGVDRSLGMWRATDDVEMAAILLGLPLARWLDTEVTPLSPHPSDPAPK